MSGPDYENLPVDERAEERAVEKLARSRRVCVLTGSGISAESGVPTFRAHDGLWEQYRIEDVATPQALARNPLPIVVPCHRAVRSDRTIGKYQGGPEMKRRILALESVRFDSRGRVLRDDFLG